MNCELLLLWTCKHRTMMSSPTSVLFVSCTWYFFRIIQVLFQFICVFRLVVVFFHLSWVVSIGLILSFVYLCCHILQPEQNTKIFDLVRPPTPIQHCDAYIRQSIRGRCERVCQSNSDLEICSQFFVFSRSTRVRSQGTPVATRGDVYSHTWHPHQTAQYIPLETQPWTAHHRRRSLLERRTWTEPLVYGLETVSCKRCWLALRMYVADPRYHLFSPSPRAAIFSGDVSPAISLSWSENDRSCSVGRDPVQPLRSQGRHIYI